MTSSSGFRAHTSFCSKRFNTAVEVQRAVQRRHVADIIDTL
jgi:hypothetical protein